MTIVLRRWIAHNCIDAAMPLLTRDRDCGAFVEAAGLDLLLDV